MMAAGQSASPSPAYAPVRLAVHRALLANPRLGVSGYVDHLVRALPFRLGESEAEATIPYAFDDTLNDAADWALRDLCELLKRRRDGEQEARRGLTVAGMEETESRRLAPPSLGLALFPDGSVPMAIARRALRLDPLLDTAVLEAWLVRGYGTLLVDQLQQLLGRAIEQDVQSEGATPYLDLVLLALPELCEARKSWARQLATRSLPYERAEKAVGLAFFAVVEACFDRAVLALQHKRLGFDTAAYALRARAALNPLAYCAIRNRALQNELNPWELSQALADSLDEAWSTVLDEDANAQTAELRLQQLVRSTPELRARCGRAAAVLNLRRHTLEWLEIYGEVEPELLKALLEVCHSDGAAYTQLETPRALIGRVQKFVKGHKFDKAGDAVTTSMLEALKGGPTRDDLLPELTVAFTTFALDRIAASAADRARARLRDRRNEYTREQLIADYTAGRIYRLSGDGKELRRTLAQRSQGHLFIDLKGFTLRTYRAKEIVMAEFLRTEFYEPILAAAAARVGAGRESRLQLQNLLGDAAVFSGDVPALVELARDVQAICRRYAEKLKSRTTVDLRELEARKSDIETEARQKLERLRGEAAQVEAEVARKRSLSPIEREKLLLGVLSRGIEELETRLREALARGDTREAERLRNDGQLFRQREQELYGRIEQLVGAQRDTGVLDALLSAERARLKEIERQAGEVRRDAQHAFNAVEEEARNSVGYGLEAGLFIAYGAAAELATMNDATFGQVKVAIAEKINEAARGTARNGSLKAKLDALLERARQSGRKGVTYPFHVYIDSAYNLLLPAEVHAQVERAVRERDPERAREAARALAEAALRDLARAMGKGDGQPPELLSPLSDLYNTGESLSGEALEAYLTATKPSRFYFRRQVSVRELDPVFLERFCFPTDELQLVISVPHQGEAENAAVFRYAGQVQFRGFEAKTPTAVYELLRPDTEFSRLLLQKHLKLWVADARNAPGSP